EPVSPCYTPHVCLPDTGAHSMDLGRRTGWPPPAHIHTARLAIACASCNAGAGVPHLREWCSRGGAQGRKDLQLLSPHGWSCGTSRVRHAFALVAEPVREPRSGTVQPPGACSGDIQCSSGSVDAASPNGPCPPYAVHAPGGLCGAAAAVAWCCNAAAVSAGCPGSGTSGRCSTVACCRGARLAGKW